MKTKQLFLSIFLIGLLLLNPVFAESENREVSSFSEISLRIPGTVHLEQGSRQSLRIEAKPSTLEDIVTEIKGGTLVIRFKSNNSIFGTFNQGKIDIYITATEIGGLAVSGSGDIIAGSGLESGNLDLTVSGSGNISLKNLDAERVKAAISGSGNVLIDQGNIGDEFSVAISGSGSVKAGNTESRAADVKISGSGNCSLKARETLKARVAGSGNIKYSGNPQVDSSVSGSGTVKKL